MARTRGLLARVTLCTAYALMLCAVVAVTGCAAPTQGADSAPRSEELTLGEFPDATPSAPVTPPPPMLTEPTKAVYSYLVWISYAYRILDSQVATPTFSAYEEVRVDSYVELNRQKGRAIDQRLVNFEITGSTELSPTAWRVSAREDWRYRYVDIATLRYAGEPHSVSYATTYTVVREEPRGWVVDEVEAQSLGARPR